MTRTRILRAASIALLAAGLTFGIAACGSDDSDPGETSVTESKTTDPGGEMTPEKNAPNSAGDKGGNAPDDVISDRPGGPSKPAQP